MAAMVPFVMSLSKCGASTLLMMTPCARCAMPMPYMPLLRSRCNFTSVPAKVHADMEGVQSWKTTRHMGHKQLLCRSCFMHDVQKACPHGFMETIGNAMKQMGHSCRSICLCESRAFKFYACELTNTDEIPDISEISSFSLHHGCTRACVGAEFACIQRHRTRGDPQGVEEQTNKETRVRRERRTETFVVRGNCIPSAHERDLLSQCGARTNQLAGV